MAFGIGMREKGASRCAPGPGRGPASGPGPGPGPASQTAFTPMLSTSEREEAAGPSCECFELQQRLDAAGSVLTNGYRGCCRHLTWSAAGGQATVKKQNPFVGRQGGLTSLCQSCNNVCHPHPSADVRSSFPHPHPYPYPYSTHTHTPMSTRDPQGGLIIRPRPNQECPQSQVGSTSSWSCSDQKGAWRASDVPAGTLRLFGASPTPLPITKGGPKMASSDR